MDNNNPIKETYNNFKTNKKPKPYNEDLPTSINNIRTTQQKPESLINKELYQNRPSNNKQKETIEEKRARRGAATNAAVDLAKGALTVKFGVAGNIAGEILDDQADNVIKGVKIGVILTALKPILIMILMIGMVIFLSMVINIAVESITKGFFGNLGKDAIQLIQNHTGLGSAADNSESKVLGADMKYKYNQTDADDMSDWLNLVRDITSGTGMYAQLAELDKSMLEWNRRTLASSLNNGNTLINPGSGSVLSPEEIERLSKELSPMALAALQRALASDSSYGAGPGMCQKYITDLFVDSSGSMPFDGRPASANDGWAQLKAKGLTHSIQDGKIPIGALVYGGGSGGPYGHVGICVGYDSDGEALIKDRQGTGSGATTSKFSKWNAWQVGGTYGYAVIP